ncbi:hypothetical protein HPB51_005060 [Rhipicephalus microplus]|uniref:Uncharacterized protein n=1 Tax=Rhipicephalus microplus TaxID=6941 RepID=A0A9J6EX21_RHIMP|nr:hypothetical protein HPB51_005060 [Rhipicephalus microplus]
MLCTRPGASPVTRLRGRTAAERRPIVPGVGVTPGWMPEPVYAPRTVYRLGRCMHTPPLVAMFSDPVRPSSDVASPTLTTFALPCVREEKQESRERSDACVDPPPLARCRRRLHVRAARRRASCRRVRARSINVERSTAAGAALRRLLRPTLAAASSRRRRQCGSLHAGCDDAAVRVQVEPVLVLLVPALERVPHLAFAQQAPFTRRGWRTLQRGELITNAHGCSEAVDRLENPFGATRERHA